MPASRTKTLQAQHLVQATRATLQSSELKLQGYKLVQERRARLNDLQTRVEALLSEEQPTRLVSINQQQRHWPSRTKPSTLQRFFGFFRPAEHAADDLYVAAPRTSGRSRHCE